MVLVVTSNVTKCLNNIFRTAIHVALGFAVLSALLVLAVHPAQAQTEEVLYNFSGTPDGANPYAGLVFNNGNLFGTTYDGGLYGFGTVFELAPNGKGGWKETVLYNFCPIAPSCTDGQNPGYGPLLFDSAGNIYGSTSLGGTLGSGAVFELTPSGTSWNYEVLYNFAGQPDAANPVNGLVMDTKGNLYGTAYAGGGGNNGAVFQLHPTGTGTWTEQVIADVAETFGGLAIDPSGNLYGTTSGSIFKILPNGTNNWYLKNILVFTNSTLQGQTPNGTPILDSAGNVYGTTTYGGKNNLGAIYGLIKNGPLKYTEKLLYSFGANGTLPYGGLVMDSKRNLYGTTTAGGKNGAGVVYELIFNGTSYVGEISLQPFIGTNGAVPYDSLILDSADYLYGTTYYGGATGHGTVFIANPHAAISSITLTSSVNPAVSGQAVTFTATVTSSAGPPPDGEIVVFQPIGQAPMKGGVATYTTSALQTGTTVLHALYNGDLNFTVIKSAPLSEVVTP
jgi:uncharacterized repeat protein (TIGR03803 family)